MDDIRPLRHLSELATLKDMKSIIIKDCGPVMQSSKSILLKHNETKQKDTYRMILQPETGMSLLAKKICRTVLEGVSIPCHPISKLLL